MLLDIADLQSSDVLSDSSLFANLHQLTSPFDQGFMLAILNSTSWLFTYNFWYRVGKGVGYTVYGIYIIGYAVHWLLKDRVSVSALNPS